MLWPTPPSWQRQARAHRCGSTWLFAARAAPSSVHHKRSVRGVRLEPVHDQTGDFGLALEVREVPDIGQDNTLVWPLEERLLLHRIPRCRIVAAINCQRRSMNVV